MPVVPRDDGLYDVTDDYGGVVLSELPQEWLPQGSALNTPAAPDPSVGLPPEAVAGPGAVDPNALASEIQNAGQPPVQQFDPTQFASRPMPGPAVPAPATPGAAQVGPAPIAGAPGAPPSRTEQILSGAAAQAARGSPGAYRAEADVLQGFAVERQSPLSDRAKAGMESAMLGDALAQQYAGDTLSVAQTEAAAEYAKRGEQAQAELAAIKQRQQQEGMVLADQMGVVRERAAEAREARATFNPNAYWDERGALGEFTARLGIAFGAIGSAITGGPKQVQQMVSDEIERNIQGQRLKLEDVQANFEAENSILAQMRAQFLSPEAAEAASRSLMAEAAAAQTLEVAAAVGSQEALAQAKVAVAKVQADAAKWAADAEQLERGAIRETFKHVPAGVYGGTPGGLAGLKRLSQQTGIPVLDLIQVSQGEANVFPGQIGKAPVTPETEKLFVPGYGYARDAKALEGARGLAIAQQELVETLNELDSLRKEGAQRGVDIPVVGKVGSTAFHRAQTLRGKVVANYAKILSSGFNPSQPMEEKAEKLVPDPSTWTESFGGYEGKVQALRSAARTATEAGMKQHIKVRTPANFTPEGESP